MASDPEKDLRAAWDDLIASLERARDAIDQPELMPAPKSGRNLAEGYRYLMGFLHSAVERAFHEDPARPAFRNALCRYPYSAYSTSPASSQMPNRIHVTSGSWNMR